MTGALKKMFVENRHSFSDFVKDHFEGKVAIHAIEMMNKR